MKLLGFHIPGTKRADVKPPAVSIYDLPASAYTGQSGGAGWQNTFYDGDKFPGGFGSTELQFVDYWTLRARSSQVFNSNAYARGIIRRLVTNEINTGLSPEACPDSEILGIDEDTLNEWTEIVETRFGIWGKDPSVCDWKKADTFGAIQRAARLEALVSGDVLVVLRQSRRTKLPQVQLVSGGFIQTPLAGDNVVRKGHTIRHGVELDVNQRQVAYWVRQADGLTFKRLPAFGERSGRRIAWLVYGNDKRLDDVRGQPLLSIVLQNLREIDRYRDSVQRKAVMNAILAIFIKKTENKMGTLPLSGGAVRHDQITTTASDGTQGTNRIEGMIPGMAMQELQVGEEPVGFHNQGTDEKFGDFEAAILQGVAWALEIPPEILRLSFSNNYSASQAAINEFKIYLNRVWSDWGETFCTPIYNEWLVSEALLQNIDAPGLIDSWRDKTRYAEFGAWTLTDWYGSIKPSTDMVKQARASEMLIKMGLSTHARESRMTTGSKYSKNIKRIRKENELLVEALRPLSEFEQEFVQAPPDVKSRLDNLKVNE